MKMKRVKYFIIALLAGIVTLTGCNQNKTGSSSSGGQEISKETFEQAQERLVNENIYDIQGLVRNLKEEIIIVLYQSSIHFTEIAVNDYTLEKSDVILLAFIDTINDNNISEDFFNDLSRKAQDVFNLTINYPTLVSSSIDEMNLDLDNTINELKNNEALINLVDNDAIFDPIHTFNYIVKAYELVYSSVDELVLEFHEDSKINIKERLFAILEEKLVNQDNIVCKLARKFLNNFYEQYIKNNESYLHLRFEDLTEPVSDDETIRRRNSETYQFFKGFYAKIFEIAKTLVPDIIKEKPNASEKEILDSAENGAILMLMLDKSSAHMFNDAFEALIPLFLVQAPYKAAHLNAITDAKNEYKEKFLNFISEELEKAKSN